MAKQPRDIYIPLNSWEIMVDVAAPKPRGMDPAFARALEPFQRYSQTIQGEIGEAIRRCHDHWERFLKTAQEIVTVEAGENSGRLGSLKKIYYGAESLTYHVFDYRGVATVSVDEKRLIAYLTQYDLFMETMKFMERKVEEGNLGILKNSFVFIHKPLGQAAERSLPAVDNLPVQRTATLGQPPDPNYIEIVGDEHCEEYPPGTICRILKPGYAFEGREIQEGVVIISSQNSNSE